MADHPAGIRPTVFASTGLTHQTKSSLLWFGFQTNPLALSAACMASCSPFACLWEHWDQGGEPLYSCTIITTEATGLMLPIHERMPVILAPESYTGWLDKAAVPEAAYALLTNQAG